METDSKNATFRIVVTISAPLVVYTATSKRRNKPRKNPLPRTLWACSDPCRKTLLPTRNLHGEVKRRSKRSEPAKY